MKDIPIDLIKYAYLRGNRSFVKEANIPSTIANVALGTAALAVGFSIGAANAMAPVGEALGTSLKASPYAPLSPKQIENMILQDKLILSSERVRRRKEAEVAQLAEKLIKEKYKL